MKQIYYKDDFTAVIHFTNTDGSMATLPDGVDFSGRLCTTTAPTAASVVFTRTAGEYFGCAPGSEGSLIVRADSHRLNPGQVKVEIVYYAPNLDFPDGSQRITRVYPLDIELTTQPCTPGSASAEVVAPVFDVKPNEQTEAKLAKAMAEAKKHARAERMKRDNTIYPGLLNILNTQGGIYRTQIWDGDYYGYGRPRVKLTPHLRLGETKTFDLSKYFRDEKYVAEMPEGIDCYAEYKWPLLTLTAADSHTTGGEVYGGVFIFVPESWEYARIDSQGFVEGVSVDGQQEHIIRKPEVDRLPVIRNIEAVHVTKGAGGFTAMIWPYPVEVQRTKSLFKRTSRSAVIDATDNTVRPQKAVIVEKRRPKWQTIQSLQGTPGLSAVTRCDLRGVYRVRRLHMRTAERNSPWRYFTVGKDHKGRTQIKWL